MTAEPSASLLCRDDTRSLDDGVVGHIEAA
jgi:hypothetical protein